MAEEQEGGFPADPAPVWISDADGTHEATLGERVYRDEPPEDFLGDFGATSDDLGAPGEGVRVPRATLHYVPQEGTVPSPGLMREAGLETGVTPKQAADLELARKAMDLRASGATYAQIAKALNRNPSSIGPMLKRYVQHIAIDGFRTMQAVQLQRLHSLMLVEWGPAMDRAHPQHYQAYDRVLGCVDRITNLLGLARPLPDDPANDEAEGGGEERSLTVGLTREEYFAALKAVNDVGRAAEAIEEAEVVSS